MKGAPWYLLLTFALTACSGPSKIGQGVVEDGGSPSLDTDGGDGGVVSPDDGGALPDDGGVTLPDGGALPDDAGVPPDDAGTPVDAGVPDAGIQVFLPGFHQPLRSSYSYDSVTTSRLRVPIARAGNRVQVTFRAGDGGLTVSAASIGHSVSGGAVASDLQALTFNGSPGFTTSNFGEVTSDPVVLPMQVGSDVSISFEAQGALGSSAIDNFPDSWSWPGTGAMSPSRGQGATSQQTARGVAFVDVEGPPSRIFMALGDSITEGYLNGTEDIRNSWPNVAQQSLPVPFLNSGVSGQDIIGELWNYQAELGPTHGLTDCVMLLGTNDLPCDDPTVVESWMQDLVTALKPMCRVWVGTLTPREITNFGDEAKVKTCRAAFNTWINTQTQFAGIIDFATLTQSAGDPDKFKPEYENDGVHPNVAGQAAMGVEAARVLAPYVTLP